MRLPLPRVSLILCSFSFWLRGEEKQPPQEAVSQQADGEEVLPPAPDALPPAQKIPDAKDLVTINFAQPTPLSDVLQAMSAWDGSNFVIDSNVNPNTKIQIISPVPVTKQEAYQAFLSSLGAVDLTVVESGPVKKVIPARNAISHNLKTFYGANWALRTDQIYTQIIPLTHSNAQDVAEVLRNVVSGAAITPFPATNSLIITDSGFKIQRANEIIRLLDVEENRPTVNIIHIKYADAKTIQGKIGEIYGRNGVTLKNVILEERTNSLIIVASPRGLSDVKRLIRRLDVPHTDHGAQYQIHVRALNYSNSTKLAETLRRLSGAQDASRNRFPFGGGGEKETKSSATINAAQLGEIKITADEPTNSLIIQGSQSAYENVNRIIEVLDQRRSQVFIEANIIDIIQNKDSSFNTSFIAGTQISDNFVAPFGFTPEQAASLGINITNSNQASTTLLKAAQSVLSSPEALFGVMAQQSIKINDSISLSPGAFIFALKGDMNSNVLQTPSLLVANNEKASFEAGSDEFYNTTVFNPLGTPSTKREKVTASLKLEIQPQLTSSDYINLDIDLKADNFGARNPQTHEIMNQQRRHTNTKVTIPSGRIIVLSGLIKDSINRTASKVPLLGDIPLIGLLFQDRRSSQQKSSLTVFITPHIIKTAEDLAKVYEKKVSERDEYFQLIYGKKYKKKSIYQKSPKLEDARRGSFDDRPADVSVSEPISNEEEQVMEDVGVTIPDAAPAEPPSIQDQSSDVEEEPPAFEGAQNGENFEGLPLL